MRVNLPFFVFYILLIKYILLESQIEIDLEKYQKKNFDAPAIIFNSADFKTDQEINFKISGIFFEDNIHYIFFDTTEDMNAIANEMESNTSYSILDITPNRRETKRDSNGEDYNINYFTIKKSINNLKGKNGYYLYIFIFTDGSYVIENIGNNENKNNEGKDENYSSYSHISFLSLFILLLSIINLLI